MFFQGGYSLNTLVKQHLLTAISVMDEQEINYSNLPLENVSLLLNNKSQFYIYKTPLLQQLGLPLKTNSRLWLAKIRQFFLEHYQQCNLEMIVNEDYWLEIKVGDRILNKWLNKVSKMEQIEILKKMRNHKKEGENKIKFSYYYTHARCCSILTSAQEQNLIKLNNLEFKINQWNLEKPESIDYQHLNLYGSYEGDLIRELLMMMDKIEGQKINYLTTLDTLTKRILNLEKYCRIWGEVLKKNQPISIARLGLITMALKCYQILIKAQFGQQLPPEL